MSKVVNEEVIEIKTDTIYEDCKIRLASGLNDVSNCTFIKCRFEHLTKKYNNSKMCRADLYNASDAEFINCKIDDELYFCISEPGDVIHPCGGLIDIAEHISEMYLGSGCIHLKNISKFKNLRILCVASSNVSELPGEIIRLQNLRKLDINNSYIKKVPQFLSACKNLRFVSYTNTKVNTVCELKDFSKEEGIRSSYINTYTRRVVVKGKSLNPNQLEEYTEYNSCTIYSGVNEEVKPKMCTFNNCSIRFNNSKFFYYSGTRFNNTTFNGNVEIRVSQDPITHDSEIFKIQCATSIYVRYIQHISVPLMRVVDSFPLLTSMIILYCNIDEEYITYVKNLNHLTKLNLGKEYEIPYDVRDKILQNKRIEVKCD